jgi:CheY-like chemotaxis protein
MRVLVAEDFEVLATAIATGLRREGMAVDVVLGGDDALASLANGPTAPKGTASASRSSGPSPTPTAPRSPRAPAAAASTSP